MLAIKVEQSTPLETDPDGVVRVANTRVPLDTVIFAFNEGAVPEEIVWQYPSLDLADVYAVISYYLRNRKDVDTYLRKREMIAETVRKQTRLRSAGDIRERLMARRPVR